MKEHLTLNQVMLYILIRLMLQLTASQTKPQNHELLTVDFTFINKGHDDLHNFNMTCLNN